MKKFMKNIIKAVIIALCLMIAIGIFHFAIVGNAYEKSYNAAMIDKLERAQEIGTPKIILIGDSNVSFGIDSSLIEKETGYEVVNLGLYRSLGNRFAEDCCKQSVGEGDIVIILHSSYADNGMMIDPSVGWLTLEYHEQIWKIVYPGDYFKLLCAYPQYLKNSIYLKLTGGYVIDSNSSYQREAFNEYGDVVFKPDAGKYTIEQLEHEQKVIPNSLKISNECVARINSLNEYLKERGAALLIAGYPIYDGEGVPSREEYELFQAELQARMNCPVISDFTDYYYEPKFFYNSILHLTKEGAERRTVQLIEDIENWQLQN